MHAKVNISFSFHALHQRNNTYLSAQRRQLRHITAAGEEVSREENDALILSLHPSHKIAW